MHAEQTRAGMDCRDHALPTPTGREAMVRAVVDGGLLRRMMDAGSRRGACHRGVLTVILEALRQESCVWLPLTPPSPRSASLRRERE